MSVWKGIFFFCYTTQGHNDGPLFLTILLSIPTALSGGISYHVLYSI